MCVVFSSGLKCRFGLMVIILPMPMDKLEEDFGMEMAGMEAAMKTTIDHYAGLGWPTPNYGMPERRRQELLKEVHNA